MTATATVTDPPEADAEPTPTPTTGKRGPGRPRKAAGDKIPLNRPTGRPSTSDKLARQLQERFAMWAGIAAVAASGGDPDRYDSPGSVSRDFVIVSGQAEQLARTFVRASERNKALRRGLEFLVEGGDSVEVLTVLVGSIAIPILANHGALPAGPLANLVTGTTPDPDPVTWPHAAPAA